MQQLSERRLGAFLLEVSNWRWDEFSLAEKDEEHYSTADAIVFSLVRACAMEKLEAIKLAINRLDGKLATPIQVVYPKVYFLFPNATEVEVSPVQNTPLLEEPESFEETAVTVAEDDPAILPTLGIRQTLDKMIGYPRSVPAKIVESARVIDQLIAKDEPLPSGEHIPMVKSVVAAHLLEMGKRRDIDALYEIFESIDGKLTETIHVLGDDMEIISYLKKAPVGAVKNEHGVYQIEAKQVMQSWQEKLEAA